MERVLQISGLAIVRDFSNETHERRYPSAPLRSGITQSDVPDV